MVAVELLEFGQFLVHPVRLFPKERTGKARLYVTVGHHGADHCIRHRWWIVWVGQWWGVVPFRIMLVGQNVHLIEVYLGNVGQRMDENMFRGLQREFDGRYVMSGSDTEKFDVTDGLDRLLIHGNNNAITNG